MPDNIFNLHAVVSGETRAIPRSFPYIAHLLDKFIQYPYIVVSSHTKITSARDLLFLAGSGVANIPGATEWLVRHIPSQTTQIKRNTAVIMASRRGRFAFEETVGGETRLLQAVFQPFNPEKRRVLMELSVDSACLIEIKRRKNQAFLNTVWGDLFIIDTETGFRPPAGCGTMPLRYQYSFGKYSNFEKSGSKSDSP